ncbi:MAG: bifunctional oligoribonuclease/PAP phosphatase NrnA [Planctomycetes bacterium]|nr:bifunctional oligoribonuclease/PAP phosphatase NrnA [Planctomycetota bacterium]
MHPNPLPSPTPEQRSALDLLASGSRFVLSGHIKPDGDCVGSQAALASVLEKLGKQVWIVNPDPLEERYQYLARDRTFRVFNGGDLPAHDVEVFLDFCELSRTGPLEATLAAHPAKKVIVDHHLFHGTPWWHAAFVDSRASATGVLVHRIARALGVELDPAAARGVFTALVTDTGWFKYSNTDAETLAIASELVAAGCEPSRLYDSIYQRAPRSEPKAIGRALSRLEYFADGRLAVIDLPRAAAGEEELADTDEVLDILRAVRAVEVVLFLREQKEGNVKLSARSKTDFDVNRLARRFGGGGHAKASGATLAGSLAEARAKLVAGALEQFGATVTPP